MKLYKYSNASLLHCCSCTNSSPVRPSCHRFMTCVECSPHCPCVYCHYLEPEDDPKEYPVSPLLCLFMLGLGFTPRQHTDFSAIVFSFPTQSSTLCACASVLSNFSCSPCRCIAEFGPALDGFLRPPPTVSDVHALWFKSMWLIPFT